MTSPGSETKTAFTAASTPVSTGNGEGRFPAGTVLAGRYRVMGLIGKGGMGEVYRAHDLILSQQVALKFLAGSHVSEAALARFRNEVRVARQVSHPNVCRVYDIGSIEGLHFISMEYLDGEDLASLLLRIGRLPQDKAIEFARKICAGLSAAHERGVLHRDLKPANIMIDGRGHVRITDFGLAVLAEEVALGDLRSGTPAYMSPEQKAGREVTTRSDLFALGLVLYEMFTGRRRDESRETPSSFVKDLDPAVERVILRCLEEDPKRRPSSALSIAMALPGGDPVAAALAAGETPSPEMVAASSEKEGFDSRTAALCFAGVLVALIVAATSGKYGSIVSRTQLDLPPEALAYRAQETLKRLGYSEPPGRTAYGFDVWDQDYVAVLNAHDRSTYESILASGRPAVVGFWYRQTPGEFWIDSFLPAPQIPSDMLTYSDPPSSQPGMTRMFLDSKGRLLYLEIRPSVAAPPDSGIMAPAWQTLFAEAGLDPSRFTSARATAIPPMAIDSRAAWTGTLPEEPGRPVTVEAAGWAGKPVYFDIRGSWKPGATGTGAVSSLGGSSSVVFNVFLLGVFLTMLAGSFFGAIYNVRLGRGDRRGARQLAILAAVATFGMFVLSAGHVASFWELHLVVKAISGAGAFGAFVAASYLAIEPHMRRSWPDSLISWSRLQRGRFRDPLVASHVLAGTLAISGLMAMRLTLTRLGPAAVPLPGIFVSLNSVPLFVTNLLSGVTGGLIFATGFLLIVVLLRFLIRSIWIADLIAFTAFGLAFVGPRNVENTQIFLIAGAASIASAMTMLWIMRRYGLLAVFTAVLLGQCMLIVPLSVTAWYAGRALVTLSMPAAIAAWALWVVLTSKAGGIRQPHFWS
ncbi:MAG TPA: serine/threonine-protein kinase [Candidatus Solibacter sp.]|nr:serine/threonine-protein kinase [Candidatus Solibacter sp.]